MEDDQPVPQHVDGAAVFCQCRKSNAGRRTELSTRGVDGHSSHSRRVVGNAIGAVHQKAGNTEEAMMSYLCTQLLYPQAANAHAEAVYRLAKIWPSLDNNQRANEARELLKSRYRNSYWSTQL